jgi:serine protease Do
LATLRVNATALPAAPIGDSASLAVGELVIAIGNPLGFRGALSTGIVHALGPLPGLGARSWVQADVRLAPGNSGGPLANARGEVIGINTMIAGSIALAIPSNKAARFAGGGRAPALGVVLRPVALATDGMRRLGLLLLEVGSGTPAACASLIPGDVLTAADGRPFRSPSDLPEALAASSGRLRLQFLRGARGPVRETTVVLATRAEAA